MKMFGAVGVGVVRTDSGLYYTGGNIGISNENKTNISFISEDMDTDPKTLQTSCYYTYVLPSTTTTTNIRNVIWTNCKHLSATTGGMHVTIERPLRVT